jgi:hypothetical protein
MRRFLIGLFLLIPMGCATLTQEQFDATYCTPSAAFERGMNSARTGLPMHSAFFGSCPAKTKEVALKSYREGYESGICGQHNSRRTGLMDSR